MVPQRPAYYARLSPRENLELFARLEGEDDPAAAAGRLLTQFDLPPNDRPSAELSVGNRQRLNVAVGLLGGAHVLLLDEPTRGMDAARKRALVATLRQLRADGVAILLATHDVELVAEVASRVALLGDGRIVADGGPRTVLSGSLTFTTAVNKLYGDGFLTPRDILVGLGMNPATEPAPHTV